MTDAVVRIGRVISTSNLIFEIPAQDVPPAHVNNAYLAAGAPCRSSFSESRDVLSARFVAVIGPPIGRHKRLVCRVAIAVRSSRFCGPSIQRLAAH
jgi:hypothetical protein